MYFDKAKIIQAAQEKEKRRLIFKAWHFKVFLCNGLEIVNTYKYQRSKRKARRISKIRCSELSAVYKLKKRRLQRGLCLGPFSWTELITVCFKCTFNQIEAALWNMECLKSDLDFWVLHISRMWIVLWVVTLSFEMCVDISESRFFNSCCGLPWWSSGWEFSMQCRRRGVSLIPGGGTKILQAKKIKQGF